MVWIFVKGNLYPMKKGYEISARVKALRDAHGKTQKQFARLLGVAQSRISGWEKGKEFPSDEACFRMGNLCKTMEKRIWFWGKAGLDEQTILATAEGIFRGRLNEANRLSKGGEVILVPRFRETLQGREEAGPPVPLPAEFIPNPGSTICFLVDDKATAIVDSPRALFILDESEKDAPNLLPFWGQVIFVEYDPETGTDPRQESGIYVGRLALVSTPHRRPISRYIAQARLFLLTDLMAERSPWFGYWEYPALSGLDDAIMNDPNFDQNPVVIAARKEAKERARSELRLSLGWRILGRVLGRLKLEGVENA